MDEIQPNIVLIYSNKKKRQFW